ncbi:MAG: tetratricopeptide repeat protein [Armatimonadota bacterium]|nr:MAG: tetratricopeptide repeat protein [Armatimonadota bacterium]
MITSCTKPALVSAAFTGLFLFSCCQTAFAEKLTPKSVPIQIRLAEEMTANEDWEEAARRWIEILFYFGPSDQEARGDFELGAIALHRGRSNLAVAQWNKVVTRDPESEWAERARKGLALLGKEPPAAPETPFPPCITEETLSDERQFLVATEEMAHGLHIFAIRDFLKITNLHPTSDHAAEARFRVGTSQALLGHPERAMRQWDRVTRDYPDSPEAQMARAGAAAWHAALRAAGTDALAARGTVSESAWRPFRRYATETDRGISYADDLFENGIFDYALQEYAKVLCDIYTAKGADNPHKAYARYRMGVCAYRLGERDAASRQWRRLLAEYPESPWAHHATQALTDVGTTDPFSSDAGRPAPALPPDLPSAVVQRYHLGEQLVDCGLPLVASKEYLKIIFVLTAGKPNPLQAEAFYKLGLCQHLRGRPDLARTVWERTIAEYADTPWAEKAGTALSQADRRETALAASLTEPTR